VLIVGMPCFGTLFTPAMTLVSEGAQHQRLDQGLAFGLGNLAWAAGQAVAAAGSGALAQSTSDLVPYSLLAVACLATLGLARISDRPAAGLPCCRAWLIPLRVPARRHNLLQYRSGRVRPQLSAVVPRYLIK